ncbi:MAG: hypothetical protein ABSC02_13965 [Acidobacteriota bacterium]|jgi:predicted RNase H-like nuclease
MPLSNEKITARRVADNEVSKRFGAYGCAVHSPTPNRPGSISDELTNGFEKAGIPLVVSAKGGLKTPALIEVYPHVALLNLMGLSKRLEYKVLKASK